MAALRRRKTKAPDPMETTASALVTIGALNWGLVGLANLDLVGAVFGKRSLLSKVVYTAVGASAVYLIARSSTD